LFFESIKSDIMAIANYVKTCSKNVPGLLRVFYTEVANVGSVTIAAGEITAVTMGTAALRFHEFDANIDSLEYSWEGKGKTNYFGKRTLEAGFAKLTKTLITAKTSLVDAIFCGIVPIWVDGNGQAWMGWNDTERAARPWNEIEDNFKTGKKPSDEEGGIFVIKIMGESGYDPTPFNAALTASIVGELTAASLFISFN
jgi:hypothetical protein